MSNDVFFLGSGFSKAIDNNYPVLSELSREIHDNLNTEKESVGMHYRNEIPDKYKDNIETLLTFLSSKLPYKTAVQNLADEALYMDIANQISVYFENKDANFGNNDSIYKLGKYIAKNDITSITLNYDTILEKVIINYLSRHTGNSGQVVQMNNHYEKFYNIPITNLRNRAGDSHFITDMNGKGPHFPKILKLHGSINWLYTGNSFNEPIYCKDFTYDDKDFEYLKAGLNTMIVPPVLDKSRAYNHIILESLWKQAFDILKNAENIYIYGFSFPPTDLSVRYLFQSALSNNQKNPKIYVINTAEAKNSIEKIYKEIFNIRNLYFDYCCDNSLEKFVQEVIEPKLEVTNAN